MVAQIARSARRGIVMLNLFLLVAVLSSFVLLYPVVATHLKTNTPPCDAPPLILIGLVAAFAFNYMVFLVEREDGTALLAQGLSASNIVIVCLTVATGLYIGLLALIDRQVLAVPFSMPYLPFTLMIAVNGLSALWSVVPSYTAYRAVELAIFYVASILIFDRADIERRLGDLLAIFVVIWLGVAAPRIVENFSQGIFFSAAKHNLMPFVCAALFFAAVFDRRMRRRVTYALLGLAGFIVAGSAASTGALIAVVPGVMIASESRVARIAGIAAAAFACAMFIVLMQGLSSFPNLLQVLSIVLQKPAVELATGTGRLEFWPIIIEATRDHVVGSGFSAADRFIQLVIPTDVLAADMGRKHGLFISSAHNMFLSAWAGTGILGLGFAGLVLGSAIAWAMKLDIAGRRVVITLVLFLILNGQTSPGIFFDWNVNVFGFVALLAYARVGALNRMHDGVVSGPWQRSLHKGVLRRPGPILETQRTEIDGYAANVPNRHLNCHGALWWHSRVAMRQLGLRDCGC